MTPYERLGGEPVLRAIVTRFVDRLLQDPMIGFFFAKVDPERLREKEFEFAAQHLGAEIEYSGRPLAEAHRAHRIFDGQFARRATILRETLREFGVPEDVERAWLAHIEGLKSQVILGACGALLLLLASACSTAGSTWMAQPLPGETAGGLNDFEAPPPEPTSSARRESHVIRAPEAPDESGTANGSLAVQASAANPAGHALGTFRNTYYDFPREGDFKGKRVALKNAKCETIDQVPQEFFESVCVQGSGTLKGGATVSFARRNCECAELCPRTDQRICFDLLDRSLFPWGRGAAGRAITPLVSVAVDVDVIPLGTALYIPEFDGLPREVGGKNPHDGCFVAEDRGIRVKGQHIDVFTGKSEITALWNKLVPSNQGVTVIVDSPRCTKK